MFDQIISFLIQYKYIFIFYIVIIALVAWQWKKIEVQAKIIFLYRAKWGLKWMSKYAKSHREWVILLGYIGTGVGFIGMVFISYILVKNLIDLILNPTMQNGVSLVLPGINVPGIGVLPFWHWLIVIFIVAVVHEFSHGIVARAYDIKVKNSGVVLFGPIIGAFVEPDEKQLRKASDIKQYSVLAAGAFSNILLAIVAVLILNFATMPLQETMIEPAGFTFDQYVDDTMPFAKAGIEPGSIITEINEQPVTQFQTFHNELNKHDPGDTITVATNEKEYEVTLAENPDQLGDPFLGIQSIRNEFEIKEKYQTGVWQYIYYPLDWFNQLLRWLFLLSLGIGLFNLLPLPIVDGGRMAQVFLQKLRGTDKGNKTYHKVSMFFLLLLLLNLFYPLLTSIF